jgi:predicted ATPase/class 3 adenylate cyclase
VPAAPRRAVLMSGAMAETALPTGTVTFLFTDIEGSTARWEQHPEAMGLALARHDSILKESIRRQEGVVLSEMGDGLAAAFPRAAQAVAAAAEAQQALFAESWAEEVAPIRVRMGVHTGEAVVVGNQYLNAPLNRCARLMAIGHGGQVLVSGATAGLVSDGLPGELGLRDLGEHRLRDLSVPIRVFQLVHSQLASEFPPLRTVGTLRGNLPLELTSFIGRNQELAGLSTAIEDARLVTVVGVGGVGKTRLAVHAAAEVAPAYADGVWLCELAGADDAESMLQLVASTVGIVPRSGLELRDSVVEYLVPKAMLLVLDNCEHLIDAAAGLADIVRSRCPGVHLLATSREPLALEGERVFPLRSLSLPAEGRPEGEAVRSEAVELFVERASAARADFALTSGNAQMIADVCRRLDGIPLAIELAAARVASMAPAEIATHLDERFRLLVGRRRGNVERHQTLRAALDWSCSLLAEKERLVFDRLGVFAAGFGAEAAIAVAGEGLEPWDILDALDNLTAKSMLVADATDDATTRYRMLETMRHYARERLALQGEDSDHWRSRHADYYAQLAGVMGDALSGPDEIPWRRRLAAELDDLRAAVNWSLDRPGDDRCVQIVAGLSVQAAQHEIAAIGSWAERCIEPAQAAPPGLRTAVLGAAAWHRGRRGDPDAVALGQDALRDGLPPGWPSSYLPFIALSQAWSLQDRLDDARAVAESGHAALDQAGAPRVGHTHLFCAECFTEDPEAARQLGEAALSNAQACGNPTGLAVGWMAMGRGYLSHDPARAAAALEESIAWTRKGAGDGAYGASLVLAAVLASRLGNAERAVIMLDEALRHGRDSGTRVAIVSAVACGVLVMTELGEVELAAVLSGAGGALVNGVMRAMGYLPRYEDTVAGLRQSLGSSAFDSAFAKGAAISSEQVEHFFLSELARIQASFFDA